MNKNFILIILAVLVGVFISCQSSAVRKDSAPLPSFYVNANGDDNNDGLSEKASFKTLTKAIASAADSRIKIITVIGTLNAESENSSYESDALFLINLETSEQITIRGKLNATDSEKALLDASGCEHKVFTIGGSSNIRFEHIGITGGTSNRGGGAVRMEGNNPVLTIGEGTRIFNNKAALSGGALGIVSGKLFMEGGVISGNTAGEELYGGGIFIGEVAEFLMTGGEITENKADEGGGLTILGNGIIKNGNIFFNSAVNGGGVSVIGKGKIIIEDGKINANISTNIGGGIIIYNEAECIILGGHISENKAGGGGGIGIGSKLTMLEGTISDNNAQDGGGILIFSGELLIEGGQISNNTASRKGGGISTYEGTEFIMSSGVISNNKGLEGGGGVFVSDNSEFIMSGGKIHNNETEGLGGGVFVNGSFIMTDGNISSNKANYISEHEIKIFITEGGRLLLDEWLSVWDDYSGVGGGIYINEDSEFIMLGGEITKNEAVSGGGILNYGDFILRNGIISENTSHFGGGVYFCNGSFLMEDGIIRNNKSYGMGGGIHIDKEIDFIMSGGIITHNEALVGGGIMVEGNFIFKNGEISFNHSHEDGGGLCITRNADFIMSGGKILKNESNFEGGGIVIYGNATLSNFIISGNQAKLYGGGVLLKNTGTLVMKDGDISLNQSNNGGGISTYGTINISGTTITGNQAIRGGGIYNFGQINIQDCILSENKALYGGAFYSGDNSFSEIKNSNITGNYASINGGGLMCLVTNNKTYLNNVNINNNKSLSGGGIYIGDGAYISISSNITNNYAKRGSALFSERIGIYEFSNVSSMNPDEIYTEE